MVKKIIIVNTFFFFKTKTAQNDDLFISCSDRIGKMLYKICIYIYIYIYMQWIYIYMQWLFHSGEHAMARGPLVLEYKLFYADSNIS